MFDNFHLYQDFNCRGPRVVLSIVAGFPFPEKLCGKDEVDFLIAMASRTMIVGCGF